MTMKATTDTTDTLWNRLRAHGFIYQELGGGCDCWERHDETSKPTVTRLYLDMSGICEANAPDSVTDRVWVMTGTPEHAENGELVGECLYTLNDVLNRLDAGKRIDGEGR